VTLQPIGEHGWKDHAACIGVGGDLFYPADPDELPLGATQTPYTIGEAKAICATCMVQFDCLQTALDNGERHGIWGGMTWPERRRLLKSQGLPIPPPPRPPIIHGTEAGYRRHLRENTAPCRACRQAESLRKPYKGDDAS